MTPYRIKKEWSHYDAGYYYELHIFSKKSLKGHSCYSCFDDWAFRRNKCHNNIDRWVFVAQGDKSWAKRMAKHYKIEGEL